MDDVEDTFEGAAVEVDRNPTNASAVASARNALISLFRSYAHRPDSDLKLSSLIVEASNNAEKRRKAALGIIRAAALHGVLPNKMEDPQLQLRITELVERGAADFYQEYKVGNYKQTFEKYRVIEGIYPDLIERLLILAEKYTDLDSILAQRQQILKSLAAFCVKSYFSYYDIQMIRISVEALLAKLASLKSAEGSNVITEVRQLETFLSDQLQEWRNATNPIVQQFFLPFIATVSDVISKWITTIRGKFTANIEIRTPTSGVLQKRYPLLEGERAFTIQIPFRNTGPGDAINLRAVIECGTTALFFNTKTFSLGNIPQGKFSLLVDVMVISPIHDVDLVVEIYWGELGSETEKTDTFYLKVNAQSSNIDWQSQQFQRPYSTAVATGDAFVGRQEKVISLANKLLSSSIESFYITGQKRVGKTSLALAAVDFAKKHERGSEIESIYILWGNIAHDDPKRSLEALGEKLREFLMEFIPANSTTPMLKFNGTIAPLAQLAQLLYKKHPKKKFVIILDEFDEMHPELYRWGNLAEAFFANIRGLSTEPNIGFILIGGENMPYVMDRQGQKLNKFVKEPLDYFSRDKEWGDYMEMVRRPVSGIIYWHEEAIAEVFNWSNGNPYFTKIICASVFSNAIRERDGDITAIEVDRAISHEIDTFDTNSFIHLWQDGALAVGEEKEAEILRRCRVLVAIGRTVRRDEALTLANIVKNKHTVKVQDFEIQPVLGDFCRRDILAEKGKNLEFVLPLFKKWLAESGLNRLVIDTLGDDIAKEAHAAEDAAYVTGGEILSLVGKWPTYQGRSIGSTEVQAWLSQAGTHRKQRLLFKLLKHVRFFSEVDIREKLKSAHEFVRPHLPVFVQRSRSERRTDIVVTYIDGEGKSGQYYASRYAEENGIATRAMLSPAKFSEALVQYENKGETSVRAVVIIDDIICSGDSLSRNFERFFEENRNVLKRDTINVVIIALSALPAGEANVRRRLGVFDQKRIDLRVCEPLDRTHVAFGGDNVIFSDDEEFERAKSLCRDLGALIYRENPLGYGNQGLLVVFPQTVPNNSLPILHSNSKKPGWVPLFPRLVN